MSELEDRQQTAIASLLAERDKYVETYKSQKGLIASLYEQVVDLKLENQRLTDELDHAVGDLMEQES